VTEQLANVFVTAKKTETERGKRTEIVGEIGTLIGKETGKEIEIENVHGKGTESAIGTEIVIGGTTRTGSATGKTGTTVAAINREPFRLRKMTAPYQRGQIR